MTRAQRYFLGIAGAISLLASACQANTRTTADLCAGALMFAHMALPMDRYPIADDAVVHARYQTAFKAYYQYFFCPQRDSKALPPEAEDPGAAKPFQEALLLAYDGRYNEAAALLRQSTELDRRFGEAYYLAGIVSFIQRKRVEACRLWSAAARNPGYAVTQAVRRQVYREAAGAMRRRYCS